MSEEKRIINKNKEPKAGGVKVSSLSMLKKARYKPGTPI